ncbi:MAG TPA: hypothetical protein VGD71_43060 [Kribbella sp.]|jgi:hypothetical protein
MNSKVVLITGASSGIGTFANLWTVTFDDRGECAMFRMWINEVGAR